MLKKNIGKQVQYLAAFGGMTVLEIACDGRVQVRPARIRPNSLADFLANTQLYYTGVRRSAPDVLKDQDAAMRAESAPRHDVVQRALHAIKEIGYGILEAIESENYDEFGRLMDAHWQHKKTMSNRIAIPGIDEVYVETKERFGVLGGKVSGAGGGGFFMVYAPKKHAEVSRFLEERGLRRLHYGLEFEGAKVVSNSTSFAAGLRQHPPIPPDERAGVLG